MIFLDYFVIILFFVSNVKADADNWWLNPTDERERQFTLATRLFANTRYENVFLYPKGRIVDVSMRIPAPLDIQNKINTLNAYVYARDEVCPNLSDLKGLKIRLYSTNPSIKADYEATFDGHRFVSNDNCLKRQTKTENVTTNLFVPSGKGKRAILNFACWDFMDESGLANENRINKFNIRILAEDAKCDFYVYFVGAEVSPPKPSREINKNNLPFGVTTQYTHPTYYGITLQNSTTVRYTTNETIPFYFLIEPECKTLEAEIQINDGCSLTFKSENQNYTLSTRGQVLHVIKEPNTFIFGLNEKSMTYVQYTSSSYRHIPSPNDHPEDVAQEYIDWKDLNVFKSINFCETDKKNMTISVRVKGKQECKRARLVLAGYVELLPEKFIPKIISTTASKNNTETASFEWWYGLIIGIVVLVFIGGIIVFCLYRKGIIFNKDQKKAKDGSVLPVTAAKAPIPPADYEIEEKEEEKEKESKKESKKESEKRKK